ncbi:hypothetical protein METBIDRAFT_46229 [Metschnikowia bicuspidata var. bicuspidata NRRL YB-4993]|uniref:Zn(2)-C6 fungal-type domain-containing protein n=1 Tax=Metschnikowia bicuspidata var. bicuspidata NRRL YB-4993 TaxID=869754 RepID=A0A1A0H6I9_9ASCO|nr:hypothetical protein METBIDRAFT_46229 [Metschnikowia bicuspidata var. bicuspidata NRRL YB-4993]OBA19522.1 hypothetical protein METBIDRAFT_46229 [Metschnikowia bicuspidata var. bicuspidata NRRL YB-4993]
MENSSLDRLAHIANMSHDMQQQEVAVKTEAPTSGTLSETGHRTPTLAQQNKMKKMACTCCRQQKSKCDAHERHPLPCTQCAKKNLVCEVNASFRRKGKRAHLARIEQEFLELKRSFQDPHAAEDLQRTAPNLAAYVESGRFSPSKTPRAVDSPGPYFVPPETLSAPSGVTPPLNAMLPAPPRPSLPMPLVRAMDIPDHVLQCEEKSVEEIVLSPQMIRELYMEYVRHYHPILPVVDVMKGPERLHRLCPALFWVVMFVALRRYDDEDKLLLLRLSPLVKNILAEISISPITRYHPTEEDEPILNACSVYSVQAFILYSLWPPLTSSLSADSSWVTIGVALFQAIRIGLHTAGASLPQHALAQEQTRTWLVCNIVSQNIATAFGFPAYVQFDFLAAQHCGLPVATRHAMEIAHFEDQVARTLAVGSGAGPGPSHINERVALAKVLLKQLDDLETRLVAEAGADDGHRQLHYLVARVHLLTCYFLDAQSIPPPELSQGLVRLFNAAAALLAHVDACEARARVFVRYLPVVSVLHVWQAAFVVVKLAHSPLKAVLDVAHARRTYLAAIRLVGRASVLKHDIAYRAAGIMRNMWQLLRTLDEQNLASLHLTVNTRMSASVFFDCLSLLRDKVGMAKLHIQTDVHSHAAADMNADDDDDGLLEDTDEHAPAPLPDAAGGDSQKSTPGSTGSLGRVRRQRRLSGVHDAESKARKIIRTIPLDPQPIAATGRSSIFKVVNASTGSSPNFSDFYAVSDTLASLEPSLFDMNNDLLWKDVDSLMNDFGFPT